MYVSICICLRTHTPSLFFSLYRVLSCSRVFRGPLIAIAQNRETASSHSSIWIDDRFARVSHIILQPQPYRLCILSLDYLGLSREFIALSRSSVCAILLCGLLYLFNRSFCWYLFLLEWLISMQIGCGRRVVMWIANCVFVPYATVHAIDWTLWYSDCVCVFLNGMITYFILCLELLSSELFFLKWILISELTIVSS